MTLTTTSTGSNAQLLRFNQQCDYTRFENVRFVGVDVSSPSSQDNPKNLVHMYNGDGIVDHDTQFVGCQFINGSIALYLQGKNMTLFNDGLLIEDCHFENQSFKSIYVTFYNNIVLRGNTIINANDYKTDYNAIDIFQCYEGGLIENNIMNVTRTTAYSTVFRIRPLVGTADNHVIIRNNIVDLQANSNSYAFAIDYNQDDYIDFAHNTLKCTGTGENINIFVQKNGTNFNFYNNLLINETNGYVFRFNTNIESRVCDYNRIQYSGETLGRFTTTDCATLADWTAASGYDSHSTMCTPDFVAANDLHLASAEGLTVANPLSYVTKDIDSQDRSTTEPCAGADEFSSVIPVTVGTATFDDLTLNANGIWEGEEEENYMLSGGWYFTNYNYPEWSFWTGFTASNRTDLTPTGLSAQFTAASGSGLNGSDQYGVAYVMGYGYLTDVFSADGQEHTVTGCYVTNNLWAYQNMLNGDATATPFGGASGNDPDWFKLTATGKNLDDEIVGTAEFYLADYRFENNDDDYILNTWEWFDLSSLGEVFTISFELSSTKNNTYGMVTPAYFCIEDFNGEAPLPPTPQDQPPYVANQIEPINFTEYPQSFTFDITEAFDDPDNNNLFIEIEVYSCPEEITATIDDEEEYLTVSRNTASAFTDKTLVLRATSNGLYVDMNISVSGEEVIINVGTATFDDVTLNASGIWTGANENNLMVSGGWFFTNTYWPAYSAWGGFTASNHTDMTQTGLNAQYTAATGAGFDGSDQYGVAYVMGYGVPTDVYAADGQEHTVTGFYVTNNLWAYNHILEGETGVTPFGGTSGNDPDWFKLTATGKNAAGQTVGTTEFYLADYRFENNDEDYVLNTWEWFDLSTLGAVQTISFELSSTKNNTYGMVTPAYFCLENFNGEAPLPPTPDEPPYVVNPVEDVVFNEYPETINVNLDGVVTDDDDPDEDITYSIVSNSNTTAITATISNKILALVRNNDQQAEADVVIRATSDGQTVDFTVHVIINEVFGVDEITYNMSVYPNPSEGEIHIIVDNIEQFEYNVFNIVGQNVMNGISDGREAHLDLSGLDKGVYFVTVFTENQKFVERIIVK